jgi:redox-sensitive bicupin YhaK (pirin superfamily)
MFKKSGTKPKAKDKKGPPHYQSFTTAQIPVVPLPRTAGIVRVIAGS